MASNFPVSEEAKRNKAIYDKGFGSTREQKIKRAGNNAARTYMLKKGLVKKGQDVHHIDHDPTNNDPSNLKALPPSKNRGDNR